MSCLHYNLSKTDRCHLDRYLKNLAMKTTQVICQSRLGEKVKSVCEPNPSLRNYWFNIDITDLAEVTNETRRALGLKECREDRSIVPNLPLCVDITLKTEEGYDMLLEVWTLSIAQEQNSPAIRALNNVYSSFGSLLKSIIAVSRATPAYKLSRRTSETYRITHSISAGKAADLTKLGEDYKQFRIGQTCTVFGTVKMSVAYRTKMTISPTQTGRDAKIMLKSDHFLNEHMHGDTPNRNYYNTRNNDKQTIDLAKPLRPGAFVDITQLRQYTEEEHILPETPPFSWLLNKKTQEDVDDVFLDENMTMPAVPAAPAAQATAATHPNSVATAPIDVQPARANARTFGEPRSLDERRQLKRLLLNDEEPLMFKELLLPFATETTPLNDLARFFRDLNNIPQISLEQPGAMSMHEDGGDEGGEPLPGGDGVDELTRQLEHFETSLDDYDSLVTSLYSQSEIDSNSNS